MSTLSSGSTSGLRKNESRMLKIVLLTGISGSGKTVALRVLEDAGYLCMDNLPVRFLCDCIRSAHDDGADRVAIAMDARSAGDLAELPTVMAQLRDAGHALRVVFLEASDAMLQQRYGESRRRHPLALRGRGAASLQECIQIERGLLEPLRDAAHVIDTSNATPGQLRGWVLELVKADQAPVLLAFESFAYKHGVPSDADLVFDVRCLPNPHYDRALRPLTGRDAPVAQWLAQYEDVQAMLRDIADFIRRWLPRYLHDTRSYLTVGIGCTGGQHRSVYVAEQLALRFSDHPAVLVRHRHQPQPQPLCGARRVFT